LRGGGGVRLGKGPPRKCVGLKALKIIATTEKKHKERWGGKLKKGEELQGARKKKVLYAKKNREARGAGWGIFGNSLYGEGFVREGDRKGD